MDKSCFNCGDPGHFYKECPQGGPVDRKWRKTSKSAFILKHPEVNANSRSRQQERDEFYIDAHNTDLQTVVEGIANMSSKLDELLTALDLPQIKSDEDLESRNRQEVVEALKKVKDLLPEIRMVTAYAKEKCLSSNEFWNKEERDILIGKTEALRCNRDNLVKNLRLRLLEHDSAMNLRRKFQTTSISLQDSIARFESGRPETTHTGFIVQCHIGLQDLAKLSMSFQKLEACDKTEDLQFMNEAILMLKKKVEELEKMEEQNKFKDMVKCGICLENTLTIVFTCGHTCCKYCAKKLRHCHQCRRPIRSRSRFFLN